MLADIGNSLFGLDISDRALRLVRLRRVGKKNYLQSFNELRLPAGLIQDGEIKKPEETIAAFEKLIKTVAGAKLNTRNVITVLPEQKTFINVITVATPAKNEGLEQIIREETQRQIPLELEQAYLDWRILSQTPDATRVAVGVAPKDIVDAYVQILQKTGIFPFAMEIEACAITRALLDSKTTGAKIIIDFGGVRTGLICYTGGTVHFTVSLPISGNAITATIQQALKLEEADAERAKIVCGLDDEKCEGALRKVLYGAMTDLTTQIKKAIAYYKRTVPGGAEITEIVLCGGGANFLKIDSVLSEKIGLPVVIGNPVQHVTMTKKIAIPQAQQLSFTTAIGLALRAFERD